jgi:hypothetical protein
VHESNFSLTYGGQTLIAIGDTIVSEVGLKRTPNSPQIATPLRASAARLFGGLNLTHSLSWSVQREFTSIEEARAYEFQRCASLPEGANDIVITIGDVATTIIDGHLTSFDLTHQRGQAGIILETVSAIGGALSTEGDISITAADATPAAPEAVTPNS